MAKKRFVILRDQNRDFSIKGRKSRVIGFGDDIIHAETKVPEDDTEDRMTMAIEELINEPGEC